MGEASGGWGGRGIIARLSVGSKASSRAKAAYRISRAHGFERGEEALEGEFLAGWIALRSLKDHDTALSHFGRLAEIAESRTEKARAGYWTGRTLEAMGRKAEAKTAYRDAARYSTVYYGQLAREKVGLGKVPEEIASGLASAAARARVEKDEVVRAFRIMDKAGSRNELHMFLWSFANRFDSTEEMNAVADRVWDPGGAAL